MKIAEINKPKEKRVYSKPQVGCIKIDNEISLVMMTTPPGPPPERDSKPDSRPKDDPFKNPFK